MEKMRNHQGPHVNSYLDLVNMPNNTNSNPAMMYDDQNYGGGGISSEEEAFSFRRHGHNGNPVSPYTNQQQQYVISSSNNSTSTKNLLMFAGDSIEMIVRGYDVADFDRGEAWVGYSSARCGVINHCCVSCAIMLRRKLLRYKRLGKLVVLLQLLLLLVVQLCGVPTRLLLVLPMGRHIVVVWHNQLLVTTAGILVLEKELLLVLLSEGRSTIFASPVLYICPRHTLS